MSVKADNRTSKDPGWRFRSFNSFGLLINLQRRDY